MFKPVLFTPLVTCFFIISLAETRCALADTDPTYAQQVQQIFTQENAKAKLQFDKNYPKPIAPSIAPPVILPKNNPSISMIDTNQVTPVTEVQVPKQTPSISPLKNLLDQKDRELKNKLKEGTQQTQNASNAVIAPKNNHQKDIFLQNNAGSDDNAPKANQPAINPYR